MTNNSHPPRKNAPLVAAAVTIAGIVLVGWWAYRTTQGDWSAVASIVQAAVATALVWATYSSIQRSDQQVAVALEQVRVAQEQLGYGTSANLLVEFNSVADEKGNLSLDLINLSPFAVHVSKVLIHEVAAYPTVRLVGLSERTVLPASHTSGVIISSADVNHLNSELTFTDFDNSPDKERNQLEFDQIRKLFPATGMTIEYFYGPTGNTLYRMEFKFEVYRTAKSESIGRYWILNLVPVEKSVRKGDGSWVPTERAGHHGIWVPVEEES